MAIMRSFKSSALYTEMTRTLFIVSIFSGLGGMSFGLDNNYWSGAMALQKFADQFGRMNALTGLYSIPTVWQSVGSGTPLAGVALGCLLAAPLGERFGRKICFRIISAIATVGVLVQATAIGSYWQIIAGRIINSVSMGIICNIVPTYQTECAPPAIRGACINFYQFWQLVGALLATVINYACSTRTDQWAYRTVIVVQFIMPVTIMAGSFLLPDTPHWLLSKGRVEEAEEVMLWLRRGASPDVIRVEIHLIKAAIDEQHELHYATSYVDCFRGTNARRTMIAIGVQVFQQLQGASVSLIQLFARTYISI